MNELTNLIVVINQHVVYLWLHNSLCELYLNKAEKIVYKKRICKTLQKEIWKKSAKWKWKFKNEYFTVELC